MTPEEFDKHSREVCAVLGKMTADDLWVLAQAFDVPYSGPDPIWNVEGKEDYVKGIVSGLREYRNAKEFLREARAGAAVLRRLL